MVKYNSSFLNTVIMWYYFRSLKTLKTKRVKRFSTKFPAVPAENLIWLREILKLLFTTFIDFSDKFFEKQLKNTVYYSQFSKKIFRIPWTHFPTFLTADFMVYHYTVVFKPQTVKCQLSSVIHKTYKLSSMCKKS